MGDIDEIIDYIKSLKKGFDKDLFKSKIDELAYIADHNLNYDDFFNLFKIWLNSTIPLTSWASLGACLVPNERVTKRTVDYSLRWILANYENHNNFSRIGYVLDWLTAAMEYDSIDMNALDTGYELFYTMLTFEVLAGHAIKLVYTLTKPMDVNRKRVVEILNYAKIREGKKNLYNQLQVLLGLFKSYKPECVPEDVPSISMYTAFKKLNPTLLTRFKNSQNNRNITTKDNQRLFWINPVNSNSGRSKKADPLVPDMEFLNIGAKQYSDDMPQKNYQDFSDPVSLLQYSLNHKMSRPARLRALLCNDIGIVLLAVASNSEHAFLSHDLNHLLTYNFLDVSPHTYVEKQDLLHRLACLQSTLMQGLLVVTRFLAKYLPFWNEKDFFTEILQLAEWVNVEEPEYVCMILNTLLKIYHRSESIEQCAILKTMTTMYTNIVFASTRERHYFSNINISERQFCDVLSLIASKITDMCNKGLQVSPGDMRVIYTNIQSSVVRSRAVAVAGAGAGELAGAGVAPLGLALSLLTPSAATLDSVADLILVYKHISSSLKAKYERNEWSSSNCAEQMQIMKMFTADFVNCFYEEFLTGRKKGIVFNKLHPQLVSRLCSVIPDVETKLNIRNHLAFSPYTYMQLDTSICQDDDNKCWFTLIDQEFPGLSLFVRKAMPEMLT